MHCDESVQVRGIACLGVDYKQIWVKIKYSVLKSTFPELSTFQFKFLNILLPGITFGIVQIDKMSLFKFPRNYHKSLVHIYYIPTFYFIKKVR